MDNPTIAIIGAGNMGASLLIGLINNHYSSNQLWISDPDISKLQALKNQFHINTTDNNHIALEKADVVVLAIKPQIFGDVLSSISKDISQKKPLIISVAAGVREINIQKNLGGQIAIVRAMPNMPALIGCGATALYANAFVNEQQRNCAESILRAVGLTVWIQDEKLLDTITPLSGSGPAYFFLVIEAMQDAAIELGVPKEIARLLTLQTAYGAARMALESDVDIIELRKRVASPGGTTERALFVLEENNIRDIFKKALTTAKQRSEELAEIFNKKN